MKRIVNTLIQSTFRLRDAMILTFFMLTVFSLIGIQLYKGVFLSKCVESPPSNISDNEFYEFINNDCMLIFNLDIKSQSFFFSIYF